LLIETLKNLLTAFVSTIFASLVRITMHCSPFTSCRSAPTSST